MIFFVHFGCWDTFCTVFYLNAVTMNMMSWTPEQKITTGRRNAHCLWTALMPMLLQLPMYLPVKVLVERWPAVAQPTLTSVPLLCRDYRGDDDDDDDDVCVCVCACVCVCVFVCLPVCLSVCLAVIIRFYGLGCFSVR